MRLHCGLFAAAIVALAGCASSGGSGAGAGTEPARAGAQPSKVDTAAAIARAMKADPDRADEVLQRYGMTEQQFEDLMYEIAADPEMSEAYAKQVGP